MGCADSKDKATAPTLKAGEQLNKGQSIVSANGRFKFILQEDGNAVVYRGERALWSSNTHGKTVTHLTLAADGVLFIKNAEENVWSTETAGSAADQLTIKDDGNLVLLDKDGNTKWESKSTFDDGQFDLRTKSAVVAAKVPIGVTVEAGKTYYWCTCGKSKNQPFCDGSHADTEFKPLAWTAPESKEVYFCVCKKTDNAPFCDGAHSKIEDAPPAAAAAAPSPADESQYDLRTKSAVVADRKPIGVAVEAGKTYYWCTCGKSKNQPWCDGSHQGTDFKPLAWTAPESKDVFICACKQTKNAPFCDGAHRALPPTDTLNRSTTDYLIPGGAGITSKNGKFRVVLQPDGNVVLYEGPENLSEHAKWSTGTDGKEGAKFIVQADGNVVLYNKADQPLWASNTDGSAATRLVVTDDGKLVLFGEGEKHLWSS